MISHRQLALVHIAKRALDIDDASYRAMLRETAGVDTAKDLDYRGYQHLMAWYHRLGFRAKPSRHSRRSFVTGKQNSYIHVLMRDVGFATLARQHAFCQRQLHRD
jgi:hypothetical protein